MAYSFLEIKRRLEDPFFEMQYLDRQSIRQRTLPIESYGPAPDNFRFTEWSDEDAASPIAYSFHDTAVGRVLIASTGKGLCFLGFSTGDDHTLKADLERRFRGHTMEETTDDRHTAAVNFCNGHLDTPVVLHLKGTPFQTNVWQQLVRIPPGGLSTYGSIGPAPGAARAVGAAVGANPVSFIVPCHRMVKSDGRVEGFYWGTEMKKQLLAWEFQL